MPERPLQVQDLSSLSRFAHDCDRCVWLGQHGDHDVYACPQSTGPRTWPTVILRWGDDGPDYHSGAHLIDRLPAAMADRAQELFTGWREEAQ